MTTRRDVLRQLALAGMALPFAPTLVQSASRPPAPARRKVQQLRITILSTMLADSGMR